MALPEFKPWPSIQRLSSEICFITEKIDGTNAIIYVGEDGGVFAGSRERWLTLPDGQPPEKSQDNFRFAAWVYERREGLKALEPGYHYGEFHGVGINRGYGLREKRWASFEYWRQAPLTTIPGVCLVPTLYVGEFSTPMVEGVVAKLREEGSALYPGFMDPEGVVVTFKNLRGAKFKKMCRNDLIPKSKLGGGGAHGSS